MRPYIHRPSTMLSDCLDIDLARFADTKFPEEVSCRTSSRMATCSKPAAVRPSMSFSANWSLAAACSQSSAASLPVRRFQSTDSRSGQCQVHGYCLRAGLITLPS